MLDTLKTAKDRLFSPGRLTAKRVPTVASEKARALRADFERAFGRDLRLATIRLAGPTMDERLK